jgi:ATP-dependent helicase HrpA
VEEFRVSLFAQELGTAESVSAVRLKRLLEELSPGAGKASAPAPAPVSVVVAPAVKKKGAPLKSLGALDQLFRK